MYLKTEFQGIEHFFFHESATSVPGKKAHSHGGEFSCSYLLKFVEFLEYRLISIICQVLYSLGEYRK